MTEDLFGYETREKPEKSFRERYAEYINSAAWKKIRAQKIDEAEHECERCGIKETDAKLTVHHRTYKNFMKEDMQDLEVLCPRCHAGADIEREKQTAKKRQKSPLVKGFEGWMDRGREKGWRRGSDTYLQYKWMEFLRGLTYQSGKDYSNIPFVRSEDWS